MGTIPGIIPIGIIVFVLVILNAIFLGIIFFTQRKLRAVNEWSQTTGTVTTSTLQTRRNNDGGYTQYPLVLYSYQVLGQTFQGDRIAPGLEVGGSGSDKVIERYPLNSQTTVYYDPQNPSDAVLEKNAPSQFLMWLLLIIFDFVLCGSIPLILWGFSRP